MTVKVGDKVRCMANQYRVEAGGIYTIVEFDDDGDVCVTDNAGDSCCLLPHQYEPVSPRRKLIKKRPTWEKYGTADDVKKDPNGAILAIKEMQVAICFMRDVLQSQLDRDILVSQGEARSAELAIAKARGEPVLMEANNALRNKNWWNTALRVMGCFNRW